MIAIFTFVYLTSKFETFTELLFHEIYYIAYQWQFSRELFFVVFVSVFQVCISLSNIFLLSLGCQNNKGKNPSEVKTKKRGRPSLLPDELMTKVISMVKALHLKGAPVTAEVINSVAKGFIITSDRSLLIENGGYISLSH